MVIQQGFNSKPTHLRFDAREGSLMAGLTIEQEGLKDLDEIKDESIEGTRIYQKYETLSYVSLEELIALRDEINETIKQLAGVK